MAYETFYFTFSLILVMGASLWLVNLVLIRTKGATTFGITHKPGTPEYKKGVMFASNRKITLSAIVALLFMANLAFNVSKVLRTDNHKYPPGLLLLFIITLPTARRQAKATDNRRETR